MKLNIAVEQKRPKLTNRNGGIFYYWYHIFLATRQKLLELDWNVLSHSPYDQDLSASDYFWFRSLQKFLNGKQFKDFDGVK